MWQAIAAVRDGDAQVAVSAGNTGALMAMAKFVLKTMPCSDGRRNSTFSASLKGLWRKAWAPLDAASHARRKS